MSDSGKGLIALIIIIIIVWLLSWIIIALICKFCQPDINHEEGGVKWQHLAWLSLIPTVLMAIAFIVIVCYVIFSEER